MGITDSIAYAISANIQYWAAGAYKQKRRRDLHESGWSIPFFVLDRTTMVLCGSREVYGRILWNVFLFNWSIQVWNDWCSDKLKIFFLFSLQKKTVHTWFGTDENDYSTKQRAADDFSSLSWTRRWKLYCQLDEIFSQCDSTYFERGTF